MKIRTPSDKLFQLVQSLSRGEHQQFKRRASLASGEKKYLLLYEAIRKQEIYDEEALREEFKSEAFTRNFPSIKHYLYKIILESLVEGQNYPDQDSDTRQNLDQVTLDC